MCWRAHIWKDYPYKYQSEIKMQNMWNYAHVHMFLTALIKVRHNKNNYSIQIIQIKVKYFFRILVETKNVKLKFKNNVSKCIINILSILLTATVINVSVCGVWFWTSCQNLYLTLFPFENKGRYLVLSLIWYMVKVRYREINLFQVF